MENIRIFFIINLIQDLNIVRPLAYLLSDDLNLDISFLITEGFINRDKNKIYSNELETISKSIQGEIFKIDKPYLLYNYLKSCKKGILISSSESCLYAHIETNQVFTSCGNHLTRITLQHGFECVGFLNNLNHTKTYGKRISFSADIICGWLPETFQRELLPEMKSRYSFTGPTSFIEKTSKRDLIQKKHNKVISKVGGIFCENIHSVRFSEEISINKFINEFFELSKYLESKNMSLTLRPHPGGSLKRSITNSHKIPSNVSIELRPSYQIDWSSYSYGISAPSSVLFDMFFAGIPVALWKDSNSDVDTSLLNFFYMPNTLEDLCRFAINPKDKIQLNGAIRQLSEAKSSTKSNFLKLFTSLIN